MESILNVLLKKRKEWTLYEDSQLRSYLEDRMCIYQNSSKDIENSLDELSVECEQLSLRLETIHSNVSALKFSKSIEERIADVTPPEPATEESAETILSKDDASKLLTQKVIDEGLKFVSKYFNEVDIVSKDFFTEVDPNYVMDPVYEIKDPYADRLLPEIIGSEAFFNFKINEKKESMLKDQKIENIIIKMPNFDQQEQIFKNSVPKTVSPMPSTSKNLNDLTQTLTPKNTKTELLAQKETIPVFSQSDKETTKNQILNETKNINSSENIICTNNVLSNSVKETRADINDLICASKNNIDNTILSTQIKDKCINSSDEKISSLPKLYNDNLKTDILLSNEVDKNLQSEHQNIFKLSNSKLKKKSSKSLFSSSSSENEEKEKNKIDLKNSLNDILNERLTTNNNPSQSLNKTTLEIIEHTLITDDTSSLKDQSLTTQIKENDLSLEKDIGAKLFVHKRTKGPMRRAPSNINNALKSQLTSTTQRADTSEFEKQKTNNLNKATFSQSSKNDSQQIATKTEPSINITTPSIEVVSSLTKSTINISDPIHKSPTPSVILKKTESSKNSLETTKKKQKTSIFDSSTSDEDDLFFSRSSTSKIVKTPLNCQSSISVKIETKQLSGLNMTLNEPTVSKQKAKKSLFDDSDSDL